VTRALDILTGALRRDMALTGVTRLDELSPDFVRKPR
jgi:L-lactate dehydrogenase (cytochrome)